MIAIRDDDTSYWTSPIELQKVYSTLWKRGIKVSLAVVPESYKLMFPGDRSKFYIINEKRSVDSNAELVSFLKSLVKEDLVEIMLHGYDHSYFVECKGEKKFLDYATRLQLGNTSDLVLYPECSYKNPIEFKKELAHGREILEDTFETNIKTFVPPSNNISASVADIVDEMGLNISGTITPRFNRRIDKFSLSGYTKKILWKVKDRSHKYPYTISYRNHKELVAHALTPVTNLTNLTSDFDFCSKHEYPFVLATHYWELLENEEMLIWFCNFVNKNINVANTKFLKDLF